MKIEKASSFPILYNEELIVVLCENYSEAQWVYEVFLEFLDFESRENYEADRYRLEILTDTNLRYLFIDFHYSSRMDFGPTTTFVISDVFLSEIDGSSEAYCIEKGYIVYKDEEKINRIKRYMY